MPIWGPTRLSLRTDALVSAGVGRPGPVSLGPAVQCEVVAMACGSLGTCPHLPGWLLPLTHCLSVPPSCSGELSPQWGLEPGASCQVFSSLQGPPASVLLLPFHEQTRI